MLLPIIVYSVYTIVLALIVLNLIIQVLVNIMDMTVSIELLLVSHISTVFTAIITVIITKGINTMPKNTEKLLSLLDELLDIEETGYITGVETSTNIPFFQIQYLDSEGNKKTTEKFTEAQAIEYLQDRLGK